MPARRRAPIVIPQLSAIVPAYAVIAAELGLPPRASEPAIRAALREADHLSDDIYDVPAALLFAFGGGLTYAGQVVRCP